MHPAIAFPDFRPAKQTWEGTKTSRSSCAGPCTFGDGLISPTPVRRGILMSAILAIAITKTLTTAALAMTAPAETIESPRKLTSKIEIAARPVFASLRPGLTQLQNSRPSVYSPQPAKPDD